MYRQRGVLDALARLQQDVQSSVLTFGSDSDIGCRLRTGHAPQSRALQPSSHGLQRMSLPLSGKISPEYWLQHLIQRSLRLQYTVGAVVLLLMSHLTACYAWLPQSQLEDAAPRLLSRCQCDGPLPTGC